MCIYVNLDTLKNREKIKRFILFFTFSPGFDWWIDLING